MQKLLLGIFFRCSISSYNIIELKKIYIKGKLLTDHLFRYALASGVVQGQLKKRYILEEIFRCICLVRCTWFSDYGVLIVEKIVKSRYKKTLESSFFLFVNKLMCGVILPVKII